MPTNRTEAADQSGARQEIGRDRRGLGLERQREAAQRAVDVEGRKRFAARHHADHALELPQQRRELRLHLQHDLGARARQQRDIARELDRVAQSLLGVQQDRVALKWIFSEPKRTAVAAALRRHAGSTPPPFVLLEAAAKVADRQQRKRLIEMRVGVILADFECLGIARHRLVMAIERLQREAAIVQGLYVVGSNRERAVIGRDRIPIATQAEQAYAAVVVRGRIVGRHRQCGVELGDGLLVSSEGGQCQAAIEPRLRMAWDQRQDLVDGGKRILRTP